MPFIPTLGKQRQANLLSSSLAWCSSRIAKATQKPSLKKRKNKDHRSFYTHECKVNICVAEETYRMIKMVQHVCACYNK